MARTLDEALYEKLKERSRMHLRMHGGPHMPEGERPCEEGGMKRPEGPEKERRCGRMGHGPGHMPGMHHGHRMHFLQRERILGVLLDAENGLSQKQILEQIHIHPSSLSELIDKLEADRYVERTLNPDDKRSTLILLTEKGKARAYEVRDAHRQRCGELFAGLTEDEKKTLLELLNKLTPAKED